jgi:hypothetical protein
MNITEKELTEGLIEGLTEDRRKLRAHVARLEREAKVGALQFHWMKAEIARLEAEVTRLKETR